jgi:alanine-glyoxylate transaminase/serine-glyoxylate transaminase/serine-pyruvate transaminase
MLRKLFQTEDPASQPFVISGSGTLGWDQVAANLAEPGDDVLVLHTGYFADSFADCFETYGVKATQLKAPIGDRPQLDEIEKALKEKKYKLVTVTHVDTSTGVLSEIEALSKLVHKVSPDTLVVVDGVCSVGSEDIQFDNWGIDCVITASQKAIGCPAGLSIVMASGRAIKSFQSRKVPPTSYFGSWKNWMPSTYMLCSFWSSVLTCYSHAKLRSWQALVLCHSLASACSRSAHHAYPNHISPIGRPLRCSPQSIAKGQEGHH